MSQFCCISALPLDIFSHGEIKKDHCGPPAHTVHLPLPLAMLRIGEYDLSPAATSEKTKMDVP